MGKNYGNFVIRRTSLTQMYTSQGTHTEISEIRQECDKRKNILEKTIKKAET